MTEISPKTKILAMKLDNSIRKIVENGHSDTWAWSLLGKLLYCTFCVTIVVYIF
jgi:hypothetical protein